MDNALWTNISKLYTAYATHRFNKLVHESMSIITADQKKSSRQKREKIQAYTVALNLC